MAGKGIKQVFATRLTDVDTVDREGVGTLRIEGTRWYKYVQINNSTGTSAGVAGDLAYGIVEFVESGRDRTGGYGGARREAARRSAQDRGHGGWQGSRAEAGHGATDRAREGADPSRHRGAG